MIRLATVFIAFFSLYLASFYSEWTISQIDISISRKFQSTLIWCDVLVFFFVCSLGACSNYRIEKQFLYMFKLNFILCLRWKTLILWAARRFWNSDMWTMAWNAMHTPTDTSASASNTGNGGFTIYFTCFHFIWFSNGIEVPVTVESMWAIAVQHEHVEHTANSSGILDMFVQSECEMLFMFSSNVCLCGHFYSILRQ